MNEQTAVASVTQQDHPAGPSSPCRSAGTLLLDGPLIGHRAPTGHLVNARSALACCLCPEVPGNGRVPAAVGEEAVAVLHQPSVDQADDQRSTDTPVCAASVTSIEGVGEGSRCVLVSRADLRLGVVTANAAVVGDWV